MLKINFLEINYVRLARLSKLQIVKNKRDILILFEISRSNLEMTYSDIVYRFHVKVYITSIKY